MRNAFPINTFCGLPEEQLKTLREKLISRVIAGNRVITSENDGGLAVTYAPGATPAEMLVAVNFALNGFTAEQLENHKGTPRGFRVDCGTNANKL